MECLALFVLLGMAFLTSGDVFESTLDHTSTKLNFQCSKVTIAGCRKSNPNIDIALDRLVAKFVGDITCVLNRSVGKLYGDLAYFFNENCLTNPIVNIRLDMSQITEEAIQSGCHITSQRLMKLTVEYGCVFPSSTRVTLTQPTTMHSDAAAALSRAQSSAAVHSLSSTVTPSSPKQAVTSSLPSIATMQLSPSTVKATVTTVNDKSVLSASSTSARLPVAWTTAVDKNKILPITSSGTTRTATGVTVTWRFENSVRTTPNSSDGMMNQSLSTRPYNKTDMPSKAITNNEEWWQFFRTNEGIAVAMASLLVLCLTICGLALMFCSRSKKDTKPAGNALPSGAVIATATYSGNAKGAPHGKEHVPEPHSNTRSNLYVDVPGFRRPSSHPTSTSGVVERQGVFPLPSNSSFDGPSRRLSAANGWNFANGPVDQSSSGSYREDDHYAAIGDATEMLRPVEERRASAHRPSLAGIGKQSAVEMTSNPTAGRGFGGMFAIEEEDGDRASRVPQTKQVEHFRADVTQQLPTNPQADQTRRASQYLPRMSWSTSAGPPNVAPGYSFPVALNRRVSEMSMNTPM